MSTPKPMRTNDTWVAPYFSKYRNQLVQALVLGVLMFAFSALLMFTSGYLISRCAERLDGGIFIVLTPIALVQVFGIGKPILRYIERLVSHDWVFRMTSDLRLRLYTALERSAMTLRRTKQTGDVLGLISEDIGHLQNLYLRTIFPLVIGWVLLALCAVFYGVFDIRFALVMLALLALVGVGMPLLSLVANRSRIEHEKACKNSLYADLADNVLGATDWVFSGRGGEYLKQAKRESDARHAHKTALDRYYRVNELVAVGILAIGAVVMFNWAGSYFGEQGLPRADWIAAFILGYFPLAEAFVPLTSAATQINVYRDSTKRLNEYPTIHDEDLAFDVGAVDSGHAVKFAINDILEQHGEVLPPAQAHGNLAKPAANAPQDALLHASAHSAPTDSRADSAAPNMESPSAAIPILVDEVSFAYDGFHAVLDRVSLDIPSGQKIAILGRSGSGKSTLASIIRGDLRPNNGRVLIDGAPVDELDEAIPQKIGVVQQSAYLFNRTLRENLQIGRMDASDTEIWAALDAVELGEMARRLPQGLDTMVDESGMRFSGGERHRIALARVLLAHVPAILLDEPTVGLDSITESALLETLFKVAGSKTLVMITHHLQDIERFDRVIFIEDGRIEMDGSPAELMRTSERFRALRDFDFGLTIDCSGVKV